MKTKQAKKAVAACRNLLTNEYRVCVMTRTGTNFYFRLGDTTWFESDMLYVYDARTKTLFVIDCQGDSGSNPRVLHQGRGGGE